MNAPTPLHALSAHTVNGHATPEAWQLALGRHTRTPEAQALAPLLALARQDASAQARIAQRAQALVVGMRSGPAPTARAGRVQSLMQAYALSSDEGVALMCLAEALLRIPDDATRDALIRDKIGRGQWQAHLGQAPSMFVNAATWGLLITGKLVATHSDRSLGSALSRLLARSGEPLIRRGVALAMQMLGEQFVTGQTIEEALQRSRAMQAHGFSYSYDMLGEAAMTEADAQRYLHAYVQAIEAIGQAAQGQGVLGGPGISIKLSALHPRYQRAQQDRVMAELWPRVRQLAELAARHQIGLNIDAEESERLGLSLALVKALCEAPSLAAWSGLGVVVQAYGKRCPQVIEQLVTWARQHGRRLMVRLVKGAYWDSEIKRAQVEGQADYPVYTRKHHTDVAYLACARLLLAAPDAVYPQFATHNAHTVAAVMEMATQALGPFAPGQYEFQCLHGMGEALYRPLVGEGAERRPCRIYAPVGTHDTLLAYLVRRLLENGANSSFVHQLGDPKVPIAALIEDPVQRTEREALAQGQAPGAPHPQIPLPADLYGPARRNAEGLDLNDEATLAMLATQLSADKPAPDALRVAPLLAAPVAAAPAPWQPLHPPARCAETLGWVRSSTPADIEQALRSAHAAAPACAAWPVAQRAEALLRAADALQAQRPALMALLVHEAGKSWAHALAEVREAVDFLRENARQARAALDPATHRPLGPVLCISPWNFPLAIFVGQVATALAAGNPVLAKPAEQTPAVAALAVRLLHGAGVPAQALQLLPGTGAEVGQALVADARVQGVMFTGSTETARRIQATLALRLNAHGQPVPLMAETGGQNAMVVDASALPEQVVADVLASAFEAAGQRCSALRVLCLQEDVAEPVLEMLRGAMRELRVGDPAALSTDVGPVIDERARAGIEAHVARMAAAGRPVWRLCHPSSDLHSGHAVVPTLIEIPHLGELTREVFGPVLHVLRWRAGEQDALLAQIRATGYALTLGVQSRIDETVARVIDGTHAGNTYVNRSMVGAVVGVQPFGGEGLSGTGPKAGGPLALLRLLAHCPRDAALRQLQAAGGSALPLASPALSALHDWALAQGQAALAQHCAQVLACQVAGMHLRLPGPTGECNTLRVLPRAQALCVATRADALAWSVAALLAAGVTPVLRLQDQPALQAAVAAWPEALRQALCAEHEVDTTGLQLALVHGGPEAVLALQAELAARPGPLVSLLALPEGPAWVPPERLVVERSLSVNTAAAGGNAQLMTLHA